MKRTMRTSRSGSFARMDTVKQAFEKEKVMHQKVQEYYAV